MFLTVFCTVAAIAVGYLALAIGLQRRVLYPRPPLYGSAAGPGTAGWEAWWVGPGAEVEAWYFAPLEAALGSPAPAPAPALVFTHGNGELIDHWAADFRAARRLGLAVLLVEYPGYGRSGGSPSETTITATVVDAYDRLVARPEIDPDRVVAWGRSVGGGAACALADRRRVAALILESTFTSVRPLARRFGVPAALVLDLFDNLSVVKSYRRPVLIVHGERDTLVPADEARALHAASVSSTLELLPCGHNDCPRPWAQVEAFLAEHGIL